MSCSRGAGAARITSGLLRAYAPAHCTNPLRLRIRLNANSVA
jgi:hypothetical protein